MIDDTDPVVRAIQAPFEATAGEFRRRITDTNAAYQEQADKIEAESAKLDEERERVLSGKAEQAEPEPTEPAQEFDYDSPLASREAESRRWPAPAQSAPAPAESDWDQGDESAARQHRLRHAAWVQSSPEPEPAPQPWSAPPPTPRRAPRPASRDDEDYSNESWLE